MSLAAQLAIAVAQGLTRRSSTSCSKWTENYVILGKPVPGPVRWNKHPWSKEMHDVEGDWIGKKAAQMGYSQVALDRAIYTIDIKGIDTLYILPKKNPDAADFSKAKFDTMIELSPHLKALFSNVRNIGHKQAGTVNLFIRGARSRSGLKSISTGLKIYDEFDEMPVKNIILAEERSSGYEAGDKQNIKISTPTIPDFGIDAQFKQSTQESFIFRCPKCSKYTELVFPDCIVLGSDDLQDERGIRNSHLRCKECGGTLDHKSKPEWLMLKEFGGSAHWCNTQNKQSYRRGFGVNQLYSFMVEPWEIATLMLKAEYSEDDEAELWNSKMGLAHLTKDSVVTDAQIEACYAGYKQSDYIQPIGQLITMGVDVGKWIHYHIDQWLIPKVLGPDLNILSTPRNLAHGKVASFEELDTLMRKYQVVRAVVDANPERRKAFEFANRFSGHVSLCFFNRGINGKNMHINENMMSVAVDRSSWLDLSQGRYKRKAIMLPNDTTAEFREHTKTLARVPKKDPDGNPTVKYVSRGADHSAFARLYSEIALPLAVSNAENQDVNLFL